MEVEKGTKIRSMKYDEFKNNDYLEQLVEQVNQDGAGVILTTFDELINWGRSNSVWSLLLGTSCCAIEFMALGAARYDMARFGFEVTRNSPRQSDVLVVMGTINYRTAPVMKRFDVFIPGCPPRPEAFYYGLMQLQRKMKVERYLGGLNRSHAHDEEGNDTEKAKGGNQ